MFTTTALGVARAAVAAMAMAMAMALHTITAQGYRQKIVAGGTYYHSEAFQGDMPRRASIATQNPSVYPRSRFC